MNDGKLEKGDVLRVAANVIIAFVVHELPIGSLFFALPLLMSSGAGSGQEYPV